MTAPATPAGLPPRVQPIYRPSEDGGILVYAGDLQLTKDGATWQAPGDLEVRLSPRSSFGAQFAGQDEWLDDGLFNGYPKVSLPVGADVPLPRASVVPVGPPDANQWTMLGIPLNHLRGGDIRQAEKFILHVNGELSDYPLPAQPTDDGAQGQVLFSLAGWDLRLAKTAERPPDTDFAVVIEAVPQMLPASEEALGLLRRRLFNILSFVAGTETAVGAVAGLDGAGKVVWAEWGAPRTGSESTQWRWCPRRLVATALPILAEGFGGLAGDSGLEACIERAIGLWLAANGGGVLDVRLPMACSGLDLLGWAVLQHRRWLTTDGLAKLSVGARTRLLMHWAGVPIDLPGDFTALAARRGRFGPQESGGPELVFDIRNRVVHPPKRLADPEWPDTDELFEAWRLAMWYLELAILRAVNYRGEYTTRLQLTGWEGQTEPVPWNAP